MSSWREKILSQFTPEIAPIIIVADPDDILLEEEILNELVAKGFELLAFKDSIAIRYALETRFRSFWDQGFQADKAAILSSNSQDFSWVPYDFMQIGKKISLSLSQLFPNFSYPVISSLGRQHFDALYSAQSKYSPGKLGDNDTKDFILRHVFGIAPELINSSSDLMCFLIRIHYKRTHIPIILEDRLIQTLKSKDQFQEWPLDEVLHNREAFFSFLQERWIVFLNAISIKSRQAVRDKETKYNLKMQGPLHLPFDSQDIRVYIDNLFSEGILSPVSHPKSDELKKMWVSVGVLVDPIQDRINQFEKLIKHTEESLPKKDAYHHEWIKFASIWAELLGIFYEPNIKFDQDKKDSFTGLQKKLDEIFTEWLIVRYGGLYNLPPKPPVMIHHIPRSIAHDMHNLKLNKIALILIDGMSYDQWKAARKYLSKIKPKMRSREDAVFAWIPTTTSISRQSAFAGNPPYYFPKSILTTNQEENLWNRFWIEEGLSKNEIGFISGNDEHVLEEVKEIISGPKIQVLGLVINKIDKIMHGMQLGTAGMHNQIIQWIQQGFLAHLIQILLRSGYKIYLTSDHGNIEAAGCGAIKEGSIAELRGQRVRIYADEILRGRVANDSPEAILWPQIGLPKSIFPMIAPDRLAFISEKEKIVAHGGITLEEVIVPFVRVDEEKE